MNKVKIVTIAVAITVLNSISSIAGDINWSVSFSSGYHRPYYKKVYYEYIHPPVPPPPVRVEYIYYRPRTVYRYVEVNPYDHTEYYRYRNCR